VWRCVTYCMQHTATYCNTLQLTATHCNLLQYTYQYVSVCVYEPLRTCVDVQHTDCNTLQLTAAHSLTSHVYHCATVACCNTLQHAATYCNTLTRVCRCVYLSHSTCVSMCNTLDVQHTDCNTPQLTATHLPVCVSVYV